LSPATPTDFADYKARFDSQSLHQMLGITVEEQKPGYGRIRLNKEDKTPAGIGGSVHGGILAAMVDIAMLVAIFSEWREGEQPAGTADLSISYLRQAHGRFVDAEAKVLKRGRQLAVVEVDIIDEEGTLCAKGRTLYAFRAGVANQV